jgi:hypothetical protein
LIVFSFFKKDEKNWGKWSKLNENGSLFWHKCLHSNLSLIKHQGTSRNLKKPKFSTFGITCWKFVHQMHQIIYIIYAHQILIISLPPFWLGKACEMKLHPISFNNEP